MSLSYRALEVRVAGCFGSAVMQSAINYVC